MAVDIHDGLYVCIGDGAEVVTMDIHDASLTGSVDTVDWFRVIV